MNDRQPITQEMLLRYLLNEMPPEEREHVDSALISDPEYCEAFQEAEYDLLDAYASHELPPHTADRIGRALEVWPHGWISAAMSRALQRHQPQPTLATALPAVSPRRSRLLRFSWLPAVAVALIVIAVLAGRQARENRHYSPPQLATAPPTETTAPPAAQAPVPTARAPLSPTTPPPEQVATLLLPETTRDAAALPVRIPAKARQLDVEWIVSADSPHSHYNLELDSDDATIARAQQHGPLESSGQQRVAHFLLSTQALRSGPYVVRIFGPADPTTPAYEASIQISH